MNNSILRQYEVAISLLGEVITIIDRMNNAELLTPDERYRFVTYKYVGQHRSLLDQANEAIRIFGFSEWDPVDKGRLCGWEKYFDWCAYVRTVHNKISHISQKSKDPTKSTHSDGEL